MITQDYLDLIPSEHQEKPKFLATIALSVEAFVQIQALMAELNPRLDIDNVNMCVGVWLDIIGQWVGASRNVSVPISGVYFSWNDTDADGWSFGIWKDPFSNGDEVTVLPDDIYRTLIRAKIAANQWDGTTQGAYDIWSIIFPNYTLLIQDNQNMTMAIGIQGSPLDSLTLALLTSGYLSLKPEGVRITEYFVAVDTNPLFAWGVQTAQLAGWGTGSWAKVIMPT